MRGEGDKKCVLWQIKTSRKRFCTSCLRFVNCTHSSALGFLLISTTDTASMVVVVDVEEELVEAGDILSAFSDCGGSLLVGGSTKLFPTS